jgi:ribose 5-phosphate isomerase B
MKVAIDADENGLELKKALIDLLKEKGVNFVDLAYLKTHDKRDYPDVAFNLAKGIQKKQFDRGILICGTGLGMAICANKVKGVYAGNCTDVYAAERLKKSNDAQVITLGAQVVGVESAKVIIEAWLSSEFQGGRSLPKVTRIRELESKSFSENS